MKGKTPPVIKPAALIYPVTKTATWKDMDDVRMACKGKPVKITGTTLDLQGCQIIGTKLKSYGENDERNEPLRINIPGFTMKNGSLRKMPGGVVFRKPKQSYLNLDFLDVGEDALSNIKDDSPDATIRHCRCYGASDKSFQLNDADGLTFENNYATGGITGVRLHTKESKNKAAKTRSVKNNTFEQIETGFNISGKITVVLSGNKYIKVGKKVVSSNGAKVSGT